MMVVEFNVNINNNDLEIISEAYNNVLLAVFKQVISYKPEYTGTLRGWWK